ncbi:hypothetical protein K4F52_004730 [Lecanicillium sp. MT-2017a]|nr:hypothetical protein K4F52_004730 [Lecanicillium sp. MT-2017a]
MAGYWAEDRIFGGVVLFDRTESGKALRAMDSRWKSTFPFFCDVDNFERHDDFDAMAYHHIYRDPWERRLPPEKVERCSQRTFDYPERAPIIEAAMYYPGPSYSVSGNFEMSATHGTSEVPCNENKKDENKPSAPVTGNQEGPHRYPVKGRLIGYMDGQEFKYADRNFHMDKYREALRRSGTDITQQKSTGNPVGTFMGHEIRAHYDEVHLAAELAANDWKAPDEREGNDKPESESDSVDEQAP